MSAKYACDQCGKTQDSIGGAPYYGLTVADASNFVRHLCSVTCVARWAVANGAETQTVVAVSVG